MHKNTYPHWHLSNLPFSVLVLLILVLFTYGILFKAPYSGFYFSTGEGRVVDIFVPQQQEQSLQLGDILVKIGDVPWEDYKRDARVSFFENNKPGDIVDIVVMRNGEELTIPWKLPGLTEKQFSARFFNIWGLAYIFWFFGSLGQLLIRPRDERWWLFIATNYLTALWLIFGSFSGTHIWESSILLHVVTWLLLPVFLHLHWIFPHPFRKLPKTAWIILYGICLVFAIAEVVQALPRNFYALAFLAALIGSIALEIAHYIKQADQRRDVFTLAFSIFIAFVPSIGLGFFAMMGDIPYAGPVALFSLPFMPLAYFHVIYRRQLGGLEVRANRLISLYAYLIIFGTVLLMFVTYLGGLDIATERLIFIGTMYTLVTTFIAIIGFPAFQAFVEKNFFGIKLPYQNLQETYASRIITSTSMSSLLQILEKEVFPSLLVRQYAFMQSLNGEPKAILTKNVDVEKLPDGIGMDQLTSLAGIQLAERSPVNSWIRLVLPLKVGDRFIGFWFLGQRDPDDLYPQSEIPILQSLANQTAIALSNIQYAEQLRRMYQSDIDRNEKERMHLALELHDSVLNELAILRTNLDETSISPKFQTSYEEVTRRLREIVRNLRPPMLMYGLVPAVKELADNLMERSGDKVTIKVDIESGEERLRENIEQHMYRIVQEACENSLRHAQSKNISITGNVVSRKVELNITDDGTGFAPQTELSSLIENSHFGLAGMVERTNLIGAEINIQSAPNQGTRIHITWVDGSEQASSSAFTQ
jgi:signal transduction histidine kinase